VKKIIAAAALAFCGLMTTGVGISNADEIVYKSDYQTEAGCMADGPHVEVSMPPPSGQIWKTFSCMYEDRGNGVGQSWYLHVFSGSSNQLRSDASRRKMSDAGSAVACRYPVPAHRCT